MLKIVFHPDVITEIHASYTWYQNQAEGLGDNYLSELESAYETIASLPKTWPKFQKNFRRFLLRDVEEIKVPLLHRIFVRSV